MNTKIELQEKIEELEEILAEIYNESDSDYPDVERIKELAGEALGIEETKED